MDDPPPFVRVVVLNFDGGQMTIDCLQSLMATDWPADRLEIVMVDNGSLDDVVERVRRRDADGPGDRAAGEHRVRRRLQPRHSRAGSSSTSSRSSTTTPPWTRVGCGRWFAACRSDPRVGAACPKMLFAGRFLEVELDVPDAAPVGTDPRTLGVRLIAARIDGRRDDRRLAFDEGFFPAEAPGPSPTARRSLGGPGVAVGCASESTISVRCRRRCRLQVVPRAAHAHPPVRRRVEQTVAVADEPIVGRRAAR